MLSVYCRLLRRLLATFALASLVAWPVLAAEPPTLAQHLASASKQNPRIVLSRLGVEGSRLDFGRAKSDLLPTLRASAGWTFNQYDAVFDPDGPGGVDAFVIVPRNQFDAVITARAPLFDGPAMVRRESLERSIALAEQDVRVVERDLELEVARAYYIVVATQEVESAATRALKVASENQRFLAVRAQAGSETELSLRRAELEVSNAERAVIDANRSLKVARRQLATLSGLAESGPLPITPADTAAPEAEETLLTQAESTNPELLAAKSKADHLRRANEGAWLAWTPTVAATVTERLTNAAGFQGQYTAFSAGVQLEWLAFDFGGRETDIQRAKLSLETAEATLVRVRDAVRDAVHAGWLEVEASRSKLVAARRGAAVALEAARLTQARFQAGSATQLDVIVAERDALNVEVERIRAEGELSVARLALRRAAGLPLLP